MNIYAVKFGSELPQSNIDDIRMWQYFFSYAFSLSKAVVK